MTKDQAIKELLDYILTLDVDFLLDEYHWCNIVDESNDTINSKLTDDVNELLSIIQYYKNIINNKNI
jgi:hypothetical protein